MVVVFKIFLSFLSASISAGVLFILFWVCRRMLEQHMTARGLYVLMIAFTLRLLIPFSPSLALWSDFQWVQPPPESTVVGDLSAPSDENLPSDSTLLDEPNIIENTAQNSPAVESPTAKSSRHFAVPWIKLVAGVWLLGIFVKPGANLHAYFRYRRKVLANAEPFAAGERILEEIAQGRHCPKVLVSRAVRSPMVMGFLKPAIILPKSNDTAADVQNILRHEYCHYRRGDIPLKWLSMAAFSLHWFNPMVPAIDRALDEYCELSCDEAATQGMNQAARRSYIRTILRVMENNVNDQTANGLPVTAMSGSAKKINKRLECIANRKPKSWKRIIISAAVVLTAAALGLLLGSCANGLTAPADKQPTVSNSDVTAEKILPFQPNDKVKPLDFSDIPDQAYPNQEDGQTCLTLQEALYCYNYARSFGSGDRWWMYEDYDQFVEANAVMTWVFGDTGTPCDAWRANQWHLPFHETDEDYRNDFETNGRSENGGGSCPAWEIKMYNGGEGGYAESFYVNAVTGDLFVNSQSGGYVPSPYIERSEFARLYDWHKGEYPADNGTQEEEPAQPENGI